MFPRFTNIVNGSKSLEKTYPNGDLVNQTLGSHWKSWEPR